jgi:type IV pilus assembly protein PilW
MKMKTGMTRLPRKYSRGFSLVEILVAMVIGLLGALIILQVFALSEGQKRTTAANGDAQSNGAIALFTLERNLRQAGWGITDQTLLGCATPATPTVTIASLAGGNPIRLVPFEINPQAVNIPAADPNTDVILMASGDASLVEGVGTSKLAAATSDFVVKNPAGFNVNDFVVAQPTCIGDRITAIAGVNVSHANAAGGALDQFTGAQIFNLGPAPTVIAYAVRGGNLTACDFTTSADNCADANNWTRVANDIVSLRAIYGKDTTATPDGTVDAWDRTMPTTSDQWSRVLAAQLAIVARNGIREKGDSAGNCSVTTDLTKPDKQAWLGQGVANAGIDLSSTGADWRCYRYKLLQTIVPLRNVIWN